MVAHNVPACWMVLLMCVLCCRWAACHSCHSMSCSVMLVWHFICTWIDAMCTRTDMFHRSHPLVTTWVCRRILIHGLCLFEGLSVLGTSPYLYHPCKSLPTYLQLTALCQAALGAMDKGRKTLSRLDLAARPGQTAPIRVLPLDVRILIASKVAVATFWDLLQDFVGLGNCPEGWLMVGQDHPFLRVHTASDASQRLEVARG